MNLRNMRSAFDKTESCHNSLRNVEDASRFGVVDLDEEKYIRRFVEKPRDETRNRLINAVPISSARKSLTSSRKRIERFLRKRDLPDTC